MGGNSWKSPCWQKHVHNWTTGFKPFNTDSNLSKLQYTQIINVCIKLLFKKNLEDISPFVGSLIPLFWTSGEICPGFQSQGGPINCIYIIWISPACNGFLRFTSGATPADLLTASIAAEPFWSKYLHTYMHYSKHFNLLIFILSIVIEYWHLRT